MTYLPDAKVSTKDVNGYLYRTLYRLDAGLFVPFERPRGVDERADWERVTHDLRQLNPLGLTADRRLTEEGRAFVRYLRETYAERERTGMLRPGEAEAVGA